MAKFGLRAPQELYQNSLGLHGRLGCFYSTFLPSLSPLFQVWCFSSHPCSLPTPTTIYLSGSCPGKILMCIILPWHLLLGGPGLMELTPLWSRLCPPVQPHLSLLSPRTRYSTRPGLQRAPSYSLAFAHAAPLPHPHPTRPVWLKCVISSGNLILFPCTHKHTRVTCLCPTCPEHSSRACIEALPSVCCNSGHRMWALCGA